MDPVRLAALLLARLRGVSDRAAQAARRHVTGYHCPTCNATFPIHDARQWHEPRLRAALIHLPLIRDMQRAGLHVDASPVLWNFGAGLAWVERHEGHGVVVIAEEEAT